jgi:CDP-diacylglycerol--glycerol-3-phosphate 3-phosphatidyltransferase
MKIYLFDDSLLLSGANLSEDYFTHRQDRYIMFSDSPNLADHFAELAGTISAHSYSVKPGMSMNPELGFDHLASTRNAQKYRKILSDKISKTLAIENSDNCSADGSDMGKGCDTAVFPLLQMGQYGIRQEEEVTTRLLEGVKREERLCLASGYFNLPPQYTRALLQAAGDISILAASPQAFGFFGARGIAGHVPVMYTHFAKQFMRSVHRHGCEERVKYSEYFREGWTFHGKGLWYYLAGEPLPSLTLIGSSNYGHRSLSRDLEAQVAVVTSNQQLREALHTEQKQMFAYSRPLSLSDMECAPNRKLKLWQWILTSLLKPHV